MTPVRILFAISLSTALLAQVPPAQPAQPGARPAVTQDTNQIRPNYVLGVNDQILLRAADIEEINEKPFRIDGEGLVNLPLVGKIRLEGVSVQQAEQELNTEFRKYVRNPLISITVVQYRSDPIFIVGAFRAPGIYSLQGKRTLVEMLTVAGGLQPNTSRRIKVVRKFDSGTIDLPNAVRDETKKTTTVEISIDSLRDNVNPAEDILLAPYDVISVDRAEMVYVAGELARVGTFEVGERESLSAAQLVVMAGGWTKEALPAKARVLRPVVSTARRAEIDVNLTRIFSGLDNDFPLMPNDILFVPKGTTASAGKVLSTVATFPLLTSFIFLLFR